MLEEDPQVEEILVRVAALDIGKAEVVCCVRVPQEGKPGRWCQEVVSYSTMTRSLLEMADHLWCLGVRRVVMEATRITGSRSSPCSKLRGWIPGWSTRRMVSTCRGVRRVTC